MAELDNWWVVPTARPQARLRLFGFPYAGGSATVFHALARALPPDVEVCSLQLPGRGFRLREPSLRDFPSVLDAVARAIAPRLDRRFVLWGHSMGALVAFELARRLRETGAPPLAHLFVSAAAAPQMPRPRLAPTDLASEQFWAAMHRLYGTPMDVLADPSLLELVVPPLKDDVRVLSSYHYLHAPPLESSITAFIGRDDPTVDAAGAGAWRMQTRGAFSLHEIPGPHLFLRDAPPALIAAAHAVLASL